MQITHFPNNSLKISMSDADMKSCGISYTDLRSRQRMSCLIPAVLKKTQGIKISGRTLMEIFSQQNGCLIYLTPLDINGCKYSQKTSAVLAASYNELADFVYVMSKNPEFKHLGCKIYINKADGKADWCLIVPALKSRNNSLFGKKFIAVASEYGKAALQSPRPDIADKPIFSGSIEKALPAIKAFRR